MLDMIHRLDQCVQRRRTLVDHHPGTAVTNPPLHFLCAELLHSSHLLQLQRQRSCNLYISSPKLRPVLCLTGRCQRKCDYRSEDRGYVQREREGERQRQ